MLPRILQTSLSTFTVLISTSFFLPAVSPATTIIEDSGSRYGNCGTAFNCVDIKDISYPFWGNRRPSYCGHPAFELHCDGSAPVILISSQKYLIRDFNAAGRTFVVVREDYWKTYCPNVIANTTINPAIFRYGYDSTHLLLYYGCPLKTNDPSVQFSIRSNSFNCTIGDMLISGYWRNNTNDAAVAPAVLDYLGSCNYSVVVPVFRSMWVEMGLQPLLKLGFRLEWDANNALCDQCATSGGRCGHISGKFACFCPTGSFPISCREAKKSKSGLIVGITVGAAAVGVGILGVAYYLLCRKKKILLMTRHSKAKDVSQSPSSENVLRAAGTTFTNSPTTPSTNYYQSTPSFYSNGKSDLESTGSTYMGVRVFTYRELEEATDNFDDSKELGDGGFGVVHYGKLRDGRAVAVKRLYERNFKHVEQFMNEIEILTRLRHPNLVTLYGCTSRRSRELLLVYEYVANGTLADHLHGSRASSGSLSWGVRLRIAVETANALAYLHASDIIHRDVKTNNILLDQSFHVKVADFGLSRLFPTDVTHVSTAPQGTPGYVDPDYYQCYHLTDKSDVYSFGVVLAELVSSKQAVDTNRHRHDINLSNMAVSRIQNRLLHELVDPSLGFETDYAVQGAVTGVAELGFRCLQQEREMRPSMKEVVTVLKRIESESDNNVIIEKKQQQELGEGGGGDDVILSKGNVSLQSLSPDSVISPKWVSISTASASNSL